MARSVDGERYFYHNDHLGSTTLVTNSTGGKHEQVRYLPFGSTLAGSSESKFMYTSQEQDRETSLYYYGARYYNPDLRRFAQPDGIIQDVYDPQSLNRYSYVRNNPLRYTDPTGNYLDTVVDIASISMSINDLKNNPVDPINWVALGADVVTTALPGICIIIAN